RIADQGFAVDAVDRIDGDADAARHDEIAVIDGDRSLQRIEKLLGNLSGIFDLADDVNEDREFVAAEARHGIFFTNRAADPRGDDLQQAVADGVSERIVDLFEAID